MGDDTLRFELRPDGEGTMLTLLHTFDELAGPPATLPSGTSASIYLATT